MIDDINNLFDTKRISSAFSGDALNALKDFNPIKSFLFMTLFTLTVLWLISMMWGYCADKKFLLQNPHLKEFNLAQIMKEIDEISDDKNNAPSINNIQIF
jgi:hypothetical protein